MIVLWKLRFFRFCILLISLMAHVGGHAAPPASASMEEPVKCKFDLPFIQGARSNHSSDLLSVRCAPDIEDVNAPSFLKNGDSTKISVLSCSFTQILLSYLFSKEYIEQNLAAAEEILTAQHRTWDSICDNSKGLPPLIVPPVNDRNDPAIGEALINLRTACNRKDTSSVKNSLFNLTRVQNRSCSIVVNKWSAKFRKIAEWKWINNPGPEGLCNLVRVEVFECDKYGNWQFRTTRVEADKNEHCSYQQEQLNKPRISSESIPGPLQLDCTSFYLAS